MEIDDKLEGKTVCLPEKYSNQLKGEIGDIIYISDTRWYLGGLKSTHAILGKVSDSDKILISQEVHDHAQFDFNRKIFIELEG